MSLFQVNSTARSMVFFFFVLLLSYLFTYIDTNGLVLNTTYVKTNFDCINLCIKSLQCVTASILSSKELNCVLKTNYDSYKNPPDDNSIEIIRISGGKFFQKITMTFKNLTIF